jgi:hypothetical protein
MTTSTGRAKTFAIATIPHGIGKLWGALGSDCGERAVFMGEMAEDGFACGGFDKVEGRQSNQDKNPVGEPGLKRRQVETFRHMVGVKKLKDVEVKEVQAVAAFADQQEWAPGEESRDRMRAAEAKDQGGEDRGHETAMREEVWRMADQCVEEDSNECQADAGKKQTLTLADDQSVLEFAQGDADEEGADVRERGVFEEAYELGGTVAVNWAYDVIGVEQQIERVRNKTDDPQRDD